MTVQLVRYDAARHALAEAHRVDEVKDIRDKAIAMQVYAKQAKDKALIDHATEIRMRAERRAGELLAEVEKNKGTREQLRGRDSSGGRARRPPEEPAPPKLSDHGITKDQSSRWQATARLPEDKFEERVAAAKQKAGDSPAKARKPPKRIPPKEEEVEEPEDPENFRVAYLIRADQAAEFAFYRGPFKPTQEFVDAACRAATAWRNLATKLQTIVSPPLQPSAPIAAAAEETDGLPPGAPRDAWDMALREGYVEIESQTKKQALKATEGLAREPRR